MGQGPGCWHENFRKNSRLGNKVSSGIVFKKSLRDRRIRLGSDMMLG